MKNTINMLCRFAAISLMLLSSGCDPQRSCSSNEPVKSRFHIGSWSSTGSLNHIRVTFTPDTMFYSFMINNHETVVIQNKYTCFTGNDTLFIQTIEEVPLRLLMIRTGQEQAVLVVFKGVKGIEDHISGVFPNERISGESDGDKKAMFQERSLKHHNYILPQGFAGVFAIAHNQPDGVLPAYDNLGNKTFSFVDNTDFLAKVQSGPDLAGFALNKLRFFYPGADGSAIPLRSYQVFDTVPQEYLLEENHVFLVGFDRIARQVFNRIVNDTIEGNILFLKVGKDATYSEGALSRDSLFLDGKYRKTHNR